MKVALTILLGAVGLLFILEMGLRSKFGFGHPLLYIADPKIGYLLAPNQRTRRYGNRIQINQYSMRGTEISPARPEKTLRILLLGDSIANGGWWTDQSATISARLQQQLQQQLQDQHSEFDRVEILNASANSWGPRNQLAYLQNFGSFEAQVIVLLLNTDDLFATAPTSLPVGRDPRYPSRKPLLALTEVFHRYVLKPKPIPELVTLQQENGDRVGYNLEAVQKIYSIAVQSNAKFLLAITPLLRETGKPGARDYEKKARQRLDTFTQQLQIPVLDFLPVFSTASNPNALYQDHIHLNPAGNQQVVNRLTEKLQTLSDVKTTQAGGSQNNKL